MKYVLLGWEEETISGYDGKDSVAKEKDIQLEAANIKAALKQVAGLVKKGFHPTRLARVVREVF